jgi:hypothetical protein
MKKNASSSNLRARSSSSKESPAPFFSIFYRGMNKISRSQDRDHADRSGDSKTSPHMERKRMDTGEFDLKKRGKEEVASSKFAHKPPVPSASRITSGTKPLRTTATTSTNVETEVNKK